MTRDGASKQNKTKQNEALDSRFFLLFKIL